MKREKKGVNDVIELTVRCYVLLQHRLSRYFHKSLKSFSEFSHKGGEASDWGPGAGG